MRLSRRAKGPDMIKIRVSASFFIKMVPPECDAWVYGRSVGTGKTATVAAVTRDCCNSRNTLLLSVCTAFSIAVMYPPLNPKNMMQGSTQCGLSSQFARTFLNFCIQGVILFVDVQSDRDLIEWNRTTGQCSSFVVMLPTWKPYTKICSYDWKA